MTTRRSHPPQHAIDQLLDENGEHDRVAFDDEEFEATGQQMLTNFQRGIDEVTFRKALSILNVDLATKKPD